MGEDDARATRSELRKIRDGIEVIAFTLTVLLMGGLLFSGFLFPRPEGLWAWVCAAAAITVGVSVVNGIRNR